MSPERQRWVSLLRAVHRGQAALAARLLEHRGTHDARVLNLDEERDLASLVALCAHAVVLCDRLIASLSDDDED